MAKTIIEFTGQVAEVRTNENDIEYSPTQKEVMDFQWTEENIVKYAEVYRFSSGRISIEHFKEIIKNNEWPALDITYKEIIAEWEKTVSENAKQ